MARRDLCLAVDVLGLPRTIFVSRDLVPPDDRKGVRARAWLEQNRDAIVMEAELVAATAVSILEELRVEGFSHLEGVRRALQIVSGDADDIVI